jgi:hypothetical protein
MTAGEQWAATELDELRAGRFHPRAWQRFLSASFERATETRRHRPPLARQARAWSAAGLGAGLLVCGSPRFPSPRPSRFALWWLATAAMLDWHLGMLEGPKGRRSQSCSPSPAPLTRSTEPSPVVRDRRGSDATSTPSPMPSPAPPPPTQQAAQGGYRPPPPAWRRRAARSRSRSSPPATFAPDTAHPGTRSAGPAGWPQPSSPDSLLHRSPHAPARRSQPQRRSDHSYSHRTPAPPADHRRRTRLADRVLDRPPRPPRRRPSRAPRVRSHARANRTPGSSASIAGWSAADRSRCSTAAASLACHSPASTTPPA